MRKKSGPVVGLMSTPAPGHELRSGHLGWAIGGVVIVVVLAVGAALWMIHHP